MRSFLEQVSNSFDDLRTVMEGRVFLHAAHEEALAFVGGFGASRHPDQSLQVGSQ